MFKQPSTAPTASLAVDAAEGCFDIFLAVGEGEVVWTFFAVAAGELFGHFFFSRLS